MDWRGYQFRKKLRDSLEKALEKLTENPSASVSISSGSGSKSVTYADRSRLMADLEKVEREIAIFERSFMNKGPLDVSYARWC